MTIKRLCILLWSILLLAACGGASNEDGTTAKGKKKKQPFVMKETLATGKDTGMLNYGRVRRVNVMDAICQHWELINNQMADESLVIDKEGRNIFPELNLFNDSTYSENPRSHFETGTWKIGYKQDKPIIILQPKGGKEKYYLLARMNSTTLELIIISKKGKPLYMTMYSDGQIHQNKLNDPFYPLNNLWRIKPAKPENDLEIAARVKASLRFFALYYRDNLKRGKREISFLGLPDIFVWYHRAIGLPDKGEVNDTWINCFYNKEQALRGYDMLRDLIVRYEFDWPTNAPDWRYESHTVLEQMYHKMK